MSELAFSFTDCTPVLEEPQLVIPAAVPEEQACYTVSSDHSDTVQGYTLVEQAAWRFVGWITVSAEWLYREAVRMVIRFFHELFDCAAFNRSMFIREGVFRL